MNRTTGAVTFVAQDLGGCPHTLRPVGKVHYLTDTSAGRVIQYNSKLQPLVEIDFTDCPLPANAAPDGPEWVQNTHPIGDDLLATIDFRRNRVVVWNFEQRLYTVYPVSDEWVLQSLKRLHPSSLDALQLQYLPLSTSL